MFSSLNVIEDAEYTFHAAFQDNQYKVTTHWKPLFTTLCGSLFCRPDVYHSSLFNNKQDLSFWFTVENLTCASHVGALYHRAGDDVTDISAGFFFFQRHETEADFPNICYPCLLESLLTWCGNNKKNINFFKLHCHKSWIISRVFTL